MALRLIDLFYSWACERLYHQFAWSYDRVAELVSLGRWSTWRRVAQQYVCGALLLEIGFGTGELLPHLTVPDRRHAVGLELSSEMVAVAAAKWRRRNEKVLAIRGNAGALPLNDALVDCIVATFPAPYILEQDTLTELHRVLRPNGRLIVVGLWIRWRDCHPLRLLPVLYGKPAAESLEALTDQLAAAGFAVSLLGHEVDGAEVGVLIGERI